ncbi:RICIN domain-containing protein [Nonomuraea sp. NPDC002799]
MAGALVAAASPAFAHAQPPKGDEWTPASLSAVQAAAAAPYWLGNYKSRRFLQPSGGSTANGAVIVQMAGTTAAAQQWTPIADGGYYSFENAGSRKNLGIDRASTAAGAVAIQANPAADLNQDWQMLYNTGSYPEGYFALKNRKSGLCLGISNASTADGAQAAQFACDGKPNQGWGLVDVTSIAAAQD